MQTKVMRPQDIKKYCNINPQAIREGLKAGKLDIRAAKNILKRTEEKIDCEVTLESFL